MSKALTGGRPGHSYCQKSKGVVPGEPAGSSKAVVIRTRRKLKGNKELFAAVVLVAYLVQQGDTLSGIAASHGVTLAAVEAANPHISDPRLIYAGQTVEIPLGTSATRHRDRVVSHNASGGSSGYLSDSLSDIPGVPRSFAACVAYRESTDLRNPAAGGNAYGIIPASGYDVNGTSLAHQKHVFAELYRRYGTAPWASDGCARA